MKKTYSTPEFEFQKIDFISSVLTELTNSEIPKDGEDVELGEE